MSELTIISPDLLRGLGFDIQTMRLRSNQNNEAGGVDVWAEFSAPEAGPVEHEICARFKDEAAFFLDEQGGWCIVRACLILHDKISFRLEPASGGELQQCLDQAEKLIPTDRREAEERRHLIAALSNLGQMFARAVDLITELDELKSQQKSPPNGDGYKVGEKHE